MPKPYTPKTKDIKRTWKMFAHDEQIVNDRTANGKEFDRWLAGELAKEREKAAQRVAEAMEHESYCWSDPGPKCLCQVDAAVAAARGGEQGA